jgi:hypothetical protein
MTKQTETPAAKPTHRIYIVNGEGKKASWTEVGAAWPNRDGEGFSITNKLGLPIRIVMRKITERKSGEQA